MRVFHELVFENLIAPGGGIFSDFDVQRLLGSVDQVSFSGYAEAAPNDGTAAQLTILPEMSYDSGFALYSIGGGFAFLLSSSAETYFQCVDPDPNSNALMKYIRLYVSLSSHATLPVRVRIWATGRDYARGAAAATPGPM